MSVHVDRTSRTSEMLMASLGKDEDATRIIARLGNMAGARETWETFWQDISDYILQRKSSINTVEPRGEERTLRIHDTTAGRANEKWASGVYGYLTPSDKKWHAIEAEDKELQAVPEVRDWFSEVSEITHRALNNSNWPHEVHEVYLETASFCTSCMYLEEGDDGEPLIFMSIPVGRYYIAENDKGEVDTVYREFKLTARQAVQKFGIDKLPAPVVDAFEDEHGQSVEKEFVFIHAVEPRQDYNPWRRDKLNMPIASTWISKDYTKVIKRGGYNEMPYFVTRYLKSNVEIYGRGPGTSMLPDIRQLNQMEKTTIIQVEKAVNPPILVPFDGITTYRFKSAPASINYWNASNAANKPEPFKLNDIGSIAFGEEKMEQKRNNIREAFHNDFFQAITNADKAMTATEVMAREEEKIVAFAPTMGRLQDELYAPALTRVFGILFRRGMLPPMPEILAQDPRFKIVYTGKISQALKMIENRSTLITMEQILPFAEHNPEILDNFNFDEISRDMGMNNGMPVKFFNKESVVKARRQQRAELAAMERQTMQAVQESQTVKNLGQAEKMAA